MSKKRVRVVRFGGGASAFAYEALMRHPRIEQVTMVYSVVDDGGSTGKLLESYGGLPVGDLRRGLSTALGRDSVMGRVLEHRFDDGPFGEHVVGNVLLAGMQEELSIDDALSEIVDLTDVPVRLLPSAKRSATLVAKTMKGKRLRGEHVIDEGKGWNMKTDLIQSVDLSPRVSAHPEVVKEIERADLLVLGPGDTFTSILPTLLPRGIRKAIRESSARVVFVAPLHEEPGQTNGRTLTDIISLVEEHIGKGVLTDVLCDSCESPGDHHHFSYEKIFPIDVDRLKTLYPSIQCKRNHFSMTLKQKKATSDTLRRASCVHDPKKLARAILSLV